MTAPVDLSEVRESYEERGLDESDLAADPIQQFKKWFADHTNPNNEGGTIGEVLKVDTRSGEYVNRVKNS